MGTVFNSCPFMGSFFQRCVCFCVQFFRAAYLHVCVQFFTGAYLCVQFFRGAYLCVVFFRGACLCVQFLRDLDDGVG